MSRNPFALAVFIGLFPAVAGAQPLIQSQEGIALENQILQLQNQVQQLRASSGSGGSALGNAAEAAPPVASSASGASPSGDIVGMLLNQVSQLQSQVQQLNGRVDTLQNEVETQHAATEQEIGDLNFKLSGGASANAEAGGANAPKGPAGAAAGTTGQESSGAVAPSQNNAAASPPAAPVKATVGAAQSALDHHSYAAAEADARAVLAGSGSSADHYKAQYILAQALYREGKPQEAAIAYDNAYTSNRSGSYAPDALLGLANSLTDIQQQSAACDTLSSLNSQFPSPPADLAHRIKAAEARAKCD